MEAKEKKKPKQCCETCIHSRWRLTDSGKILRRDTGVCLAMYDSKKLSVPQCVPIQQHIVFSGSGKDCALYEMNDGEKFNCEGYQFIQRKKGE